MRHVRETAFATILLAAVPASGHESLAIAAAERTIEEIFGPRGDPASHRPHECGAPAWRLVEETWDRIDPALRSLVHARVDSLDETLQTANYQFHYTTDEASVDRIELDYRDRLASYCETAYAYFRDEFGLVLPTGTGPIGENGRPRIQVRVYRHGRYSGLASGVSELGSPCPGSSSARFSIDNELRDESLRRTSAHETFHMYTHMIDASERDWLQESSARWSEWHVWPDHWTFHGVTALLQTPYSTPWGRYPDQRMYGGVLFWYFLEHVLAAERAPVLQVWDAACTTDFESGVAAVLRTHDRDLKGILRQFWRWNYRTGVYDDGRHYDDGARIPWVRFQEQHATYPVENAAIDEVELARSGGANFIRFKGEATRANLRIRFDGEPEAAAHRAVSLVATSFLSTHTEDREYLPDESGNIVAVIENWHLYDSVGMIVTNDPDAPSERLEYVYSVEEFGSEVFDADWSMTLDQFRERRLQVAPNPFRDAVEIRFRVDAGTGGAAVSVVDVTGRLVRTLTSGSRPVGDHYTAWDGTDADGRLLTSGVYFLTLRNGGRLDTRRVSLVR